MKINLMRLFESLTYIKHGYAFEHIVTDISSRIKGIKVPGVQLWTRYMN